MKKLFRKPPREIPHLSKFCTEYIKLVLTEQLCARVNIYCANLKRGTAQAKKDNEGIYYYRITIPSWTFKHNDVEYVEYYILHEVCHVLQFEEGHRMDHGPTFYKWFKTLCPEHLWHYETFYKPRNAAAGLK